jgi:DNA polymerase elongation subunit (family B)
MRLLTIDTETLPHELYGFGMFNQNFSLDQLKTAGTIASWAAKWHGERGVHFASVHEMSEKAMLKKAALLLDEADAVIGWNSASFDVKWLQGQFIKHRIMEPSPFKQIDLLRTARNKFKVASNKLDYWAQFLGIGCKVKTGGFELWRKCMEGDPKAWARMKRYNICDVRLTEKVYDRMLPWIKNHPNVSSHESGECCPKCQGEKHQRRGYQYTQARRYARFQCITPRVWDDGVSRPCGAWFQSTRCDPGTAKIKAIA